jgi:16S rRNA (adenine1518-N6/adenine1519-N6)-dimethyltransferase
VLGRHGLAAKHHLGQNFLVSDAVIGRILDLAELSRTDVVYEIGPGIGTLTCALLAQAGAVVAVEADPSLPPVLQETCVRDGERLALVQGDALRVGVRELEAAVRTLGLPGVGTTPNKLVSNLPYQVAATVVLGTFVGMPEVSRAVVMVQAEVADRMSARPGTKAYGGYTAKLALYARPTGRFEVGPRNFLPAPHVDSAVIRLERTELCDPSTGEPLTDARRASCCALIDTAFAQRRKTLRNNLRAWGTDSAVLDAALAEAGVDGRLRAEALAPEDFVRLDGCLMSAHV